MSATNTNWIMQDDGSVLLRFDKSAHSREAIAATAYKFNDRAVININAQEDYFEVCLQTLPDQNDICLSHLATCFSSEAIDQQVRLDLDERFGHIREIIFEHAFAAPQSISCKKKTEIAWSKYQILPFSFRRMGTNTLLLVNQAGEYLFIHPKDFDTLLNGTQAKNSNLYQNLKSKQFIADGELETSISLLSTKLRTRKAHLRNFTALHMVVLTAYCNCKCDYCQASSMAPEVQSLSMTKETARKVVDMIFCTPSPNIKIEFQGGEPTINWDVLQFIVKYAKRINCKANKHLEFVVCTNLKYISRSMACYLMNNNVAISTSLDGPKYLHDKHRLAHDGESTYDAFRKNLALVNSVMEYSSCSPLLTVTQDHLHHLREIIDEYVRLGFKGIFLRPINPYGLARSKWESLGYPIEDFIEAYKDALEYIININLNGYYFPEYYTTLLLSRILTPFSTGFVDLQSPSGAGINGVIYDFDGSVYPTDEGRMLARMGDDRFRLGNVYTDTYADIFLGSKLRELTRSSCVETLPGCAFCAYQLYCGSDPIRNYVEAGDIIGYRPTSSFCKKNSAIFDHLFNLIYEDHEPYMDVFWSWITNRNLKDIQL
jgi:uncharacterized protein